MFCMYCGQKLPDQAKFCFICGNKIELEIEEEVVKPVLEQEEQEEQLLFVDNYDNDISIFDDVNDVDDINVSEDNDYVSIDENTNSINAFGKQLLGKDPTSIYVEAVEAILKKYPQLIGQKDAYFTTDIFKADNYTGKTRELFINGSTVYVKTGFSTQAKWSNIKAICKLAGISFYLGQNAGIESEPVQTVSNTESICDNQNIISDDISLNKQVNPISKIDIKEFIGKIDVNAAFSRCDINVNGCGYRNVNSINYVQYNNHIYFLVYKDQIGKVKPCKLTIERQLITDLIFETRELLYDEYSEKWDDISEEFEDLFSELSKRSDERCLVEEYKLLLKNILTDFLSKIEEKSKKLSLSNSYLSVIEKIASYVSDNTIDKSYNNAYAMELNKIEYQYVVFGSINLLDYKVEILKEYRSSLWAGNRSHCELGWTYKGPVISISNNKIWYITYIYDDKDAYGDEHGNLAVKCLDIITREESIVMELPKVREAYMPIVMGNILAYLADGKLVCHNMLTGKVSKKECKQILGYNSSYVFFSKEYGNKYIENKYILDVNTGEFVRMANYIKEQLMINEKIKELYYMDCKNGYIYVSVTRKVKELYGTCDKWYEAYIDVTKRNIEIISESNSGGAYKFIDSFDGRFGNVSFDGSLYVIVNKGNSASYRDECPAQWENFLVRVDRDGSRHYTKCNEYPDERNILVPLWDGNLIAKLNTGQISLFHNGTWHTIFDSNENV